MLEELVRELSNRRKGRKKTTSTHLSLEDLGDFIEKLKDCKLSDVKYRAVTNFAPQSRRDRRLRNYDYLVRGNEKGFLSMRLTTLMESQSIEEAHYRTVKIQHEVYTGENDERHYLDVYRHISSEPWWLKIISIEYTTVAG